MNCKTNYFRDNILFYLYRMRNTKFNADEKWIISYICNWSWIYRNSINSVIKKNYMTLTFDVDVKTSGISYFTCRCHYTIYISKFMRLYIFASDAHVLRQKSPSWIRAYALTVEKGVWHMLSIRKILFNSLVHSNF